MLRLLFIILLFSLNLISAPIISIKDTVFDYGTIFQGEKEYISHAFTIKNIGNKILKIKKIRASCGCTVVEYDSLISPNQKGKIIQKVNIKKFRPGAAFKPIEIYSNAKNKPKLKLGIRVTIEKTIDVSTNHIILEPSNIEIPFLISVKTKKNDLSINDVSFKLDEKIKTWGPKIPIKIQYDFTNTPRMVDEEFEYSLQLFYPKEIDSKKAGTFIISTNHPKKKIVTIPGIIR